MMKSERNLKQFQQMLYHICGLTLLSNKSLKRFWASAKQQNAFGPGLLLQSMFRRLIVAAVIIAAIWLALFVFIWN